MDHTDRQQRAAVADVQSALNEAVRTAAAWGEKAPDEARFAELKRIAGASSALCAQADSEIARLKRLEAGWIELVTRLCP